MRLSKYAGLGKNCLIPAIAFVVAACGTAATTGSQSQVLRETLVPRGLAINKACDSLTDVYRNMQSVGGIMQNYLNKVENEAISMNDLGAVIQLMSDSAEKVSWNVNELATSQADKEEASRILAAAMQSNARCNSFFSLQFKDERLPMETRLALFETDCSKPMENLKSLKCEEPEEAVCAGIADDALGVLKRKVVLSAGGFCGLGEKTVTSWLKEVYVEGDQAHSKCDIAYNKRLDFTAIEWIKEEAKSCSPRGAAPSPPTEVPPLSIVVGDEEIRHVSGGKLEKYRAGALIGTQDFGAARPVRALLYVDGVTLVAAGDLVVKLRGTGGTGSNMFALTGDGGSVSGYNYRIGSQLKLRASSVEYSKLHNVLQVKTVGGRTLSLRGTGGTGHNMFALDPKEECSGLPGYDYLISCL